MRLHFQIQQKFVSFQFLQCHGGLPFFEHIQTQTIFNFATGFHKLLLIMHAY